MLFVNKDENEQFQKRIIISMFLENYDNYKFINYYNDFLFSVLDGEKLILISLFGYSTEAIKKVITSNFSNLIIYYFNERSHNYHLSKLKKELVNINIYVEYFTEHFRERYDLYKNNTVEYITSKFGENNTEPIFNKYTTYYNIKTEKDLLYQYRSDQSPVINLFIANHLSYNNPRKFNDPFDCDIEVLSANEFIYIMNKSYKEIMNKKFPYNQIDEKSLDYLENKNFEGLIKYLLEKDNNNLKNYNYNKILNYFNKTFSEYINIKEKFRVLCVTTEYNNILMWSYYANSHYGICFEHDFFNICKGTENHFINGVCYYGKVKYDEVRPNVKVKEPKYHDDYSFANLVNNNIELLFTKYKGWKHENEFRFVVLSSSVKSDYENIDSNVLKYYLGCNYQNNLKLNVNVNKDRMVKDNRDYKLNIA